MDKTARLNRPLHGRVKRLSFQDGYGFLESLDGREIYFHENSVLNGDFSGLDIGMEVVYSEEMGAKGPQASSLRRVGHNGYHAFPRHHVAKGAGTPMRDIYGPPIPAHTGMLRANFGGGSPATGRNWLALLAGVALGGVAMYAFDSSRGAELSRP